MSNKIKVTPLEKALHPVGAGEFDDGGPGGITVRNTFGRKLLDIRNRAIHKGMKLKSLDDILFEIADGRKEL